VGAEGGGEKGNKITDAAVRLSKEPAPAAPAHPQTTENVSHRRAKHEVARIGSPGSRFSQSSPRSSTTAGYSPSRQVVARLSSPFSSHSPPELPLNSTGRRSGSGEGGAERESSLQGMSSDEARPTELAGGLQNGGNVSVNNGNIGEISVEDESKMLQGIDSLYAPAESGRRDEMLRVLARQGSLVDALMRAMCKYGKQVCVCL